MKDFFNNAFRSIGLSRLTVFIKQLMNDFFENKYFGVEENLLAALRAFVNLYYFKAVAKELLFETSSTKENRFLLYDLIKKDTEHEMKGLGDFFKELLVHEYNDKSQNSPEENRVLGLEGDFF